MLPYSTVQILLLLRLLTASPLFNRVIIHVHSCSQNDDHGYRSYHISVGNVDSPLNQSRWLLMLEQGSYRSGNNSPGHGEPRQREVAYPRFMLGFVKPLTIEDLSHILRCTLPLWEPTRGQRIFISGGTGFFGAWLLESLTYCNRELKLDLRATVLTRNPTAFAQKLPHLAGDASITLLHGDVCEFSFPQDDFEYVIHGAASTASAAPPIELMRTIVHGTERMLAFAKSHNVQRFLFISSGAVYGRQPEKFRRRFLRVLKTAIAALAFYALASVIAQNGF